MTTTAQALTLTISKLLYQAELKTKVAETFKQCLTDTYRPHVLQNKLYGDTIEYLQEDLTTRQQATDTLLEGLQALAHETTQLADAYEKGHQTLVARDLRDLRDTLTEHLTQYREDVGP